LHQQIHILKVCVESFQNPVLECFYDLWLCFYANFCVYRRVATLLLGRGAPLSKKSLGRGASLPKTFSGRVAPLPKFGKGCTSSSQEGGLPTNPMKNKYCLHDFKAA